LNQPESPLLYVGTYQAGYPRNRLMIEAFRRAGFKVLELNVAVWDTASTGGKRGGWFGWSRARLAVNFLAAYPRLIRGVARNLRAASALVIGYPGQVDMLVLAPLAKLWRKPVVFNPLVTLTDTVIEDRELANASSVTGRCVKLVDRLALKLADLVIVDTAENGDYIVRHFDMPAERIVVVPVGADADLFDPGHYPERSLTVDRPLRVLFYGKYIPLHGVETILRAAKILQDANAPVVLDLVGSGQTYAEMRHLANSLSLTNVRFLDPVPFAELPERLASADVVLGIFGKTMKAGRVVPNKVFQAMAMGSAIVTRRSNPIEAVLRDHESALLVEPGSAEELAAAILELRDERLRLRLGNAARQAYVDHAAPEIMAERAGRAMRELLCQTRERARLLGFGSAR